MLLLVMLLLLLLLFVLVLLSPTKFCKVCQWAAEMQTC
jgi:hypothetical protein